MNAAHCLRQLARSADWNVVAANSFEGYHSELLDYVCLLRDERLTVKLYVFQPAPKYIVAPHNHRFVFEHHTLYGAIENHLFNEHGGDTWGRYQYRAETHAAERVGSCGLTTVLVESNGHFLMQPHQIHSLVIPKPSAALQFQYHDEHRGPTWLYSKAPPDCAMNDRLYRRPTTAWCRDLVHETLSRV